MRPAACESNLCPSTRPRCSIRPRTFAGGKWARRWTQIRFLGQSHLCSICRHNLPRRKSLDSASPDSQRPQSPITGYGQFVIAPCRAPVPWRMAWFPASSGQFRELDLPFQGKQYSQGWAASARSAATGGLDADILRYSNSHPLSVDFAVPLSDNFVGLPF